MATGDVVRRLTITANQTGVDETTASMNKLADSTTALANVTDTNATRALSAEAAYAKLNNTIDSGAKSQSAIAKGTATLNAALDQGVISQDQYTDSLSKLNDKYSSTGSFVSEISSVFGGLGSMIAAGGAIAALSSIIDSVVKVNKDLADMQTNANQVGLTLKDFQSIQFGGALSGLSTDQVNAGLQQSATLLNDASRNSNTLSKELAANGISVKNTNGDLISQNQLLGIAANLIANAKNPGDAAAIATMIGFTKEWIPLLGEGKSGLDALGPAAQAAGATTAAATLTAAGTAAGAAIAAGASTAAAALGLGGTTAGTATATGGTVAGRCSDNWRRSCRRNRWRWWRNGRCSTRDWWRSGRRALWGPIAALAAAAAGIGLSIFGGSSGPSMADKLKADQQLADQINQQNSDANDRKTLDAQNGQLAGIDQTTLTGQLQAFDISSQQQREAEAKAGNGAIVELEASLAAQRLAIIQKSNDAITKTMDDFLTSIQTGSLSILSPQQQLQSEQDLFNTQLSGAQNGNSDDLNALTGTAQALLTLAQNFYASGTGYADTYKQVTDAIQSIANNPTQSVAPDLGITNLQDVVAGYGASNDGVWSATNLVAAPATDSLSGMAEGGIVGNGIFNKDSVRARYAGGGSIALAGGEAVTRATSVNANTIGMLNHINKTGKTPSNNNADVIRVLTQGFNGLGGKLDEQTAALAGRVKSLEDTTRQTNNRRRIPGTKAA